MSAKDLVKRIADEDIKYVDIRFTDPRGRLQHVTVINDEVDEDFLEGGFMFDGSSIAGWKSIEESDMKLIPDTNSAYLDPFYAEKTLCVHCHVVEPDTGETYERCPRSTAMRAEEHLVASGIGDTSFWGPEAEFFLFDDVRYSNTINKVSYEVDASDASWNTDTEFEMGNMGHRPGIKGGYFPVNPTDASHDLRGEMLSTMKNIGMKVDKHHHEVASCQLRHSRVPGAREESNPLDAPTFLPRFLLARRPQPRIPLWHPRKGPPSRRTAATRPRRTSGWTSARA